jgi:hypothetical protein
MIIIYKNSFKMSNNYLDGQIYESVILKSEDSINSSVFPNSNVVDDQKLERTLSKEVINQGNTHPFNQSQPTGNNFNNMNYPNNMNMNQMQCNMQNMNNMGYNMYNTQFNPMGSIYNKNVNDLADTRVFMKKQVDIICQDHRNKNLPDVNVTEATRFCSKCETIICDSCVIDYHLDHVSQAKLKVDEYFSQQKNDLNEVLNSNRYYIQNEVYLDEIKRKKEEMLSKIERYFSSRDLAYENVQKKLKSLKDEEEHLKKGIILAIESFFIDECQKKLDDSTKGLKESKLYHYFSE